MISNTVFNQHEKGYTNKQRSESTDNELEMSSMAYSHSLYYIDNWWNGERSNNIL